MGTLPAKRNRHQSIQVNVRTDARLPNDLEIGGRETLRPTPDILDALEKDYPLEASIADLVDNSIDAKAKNILVRFVKKERRLSSLYVIDDGVGMNAGVLKRAMQFAARRNYGPKDLGMFGVGLKTASLSQANTLTVVSRAAGQAAVGRQWTKEGIKTNDWTVNILKSQSATALLNHEWGLVGPITVGTVVRWDDIYDFDRLRIDMDGYLERAILRMRHHLGLKLNRFLQRRQITIHIDVEDIDEQDVGPATEVLAINPFPPKALNGAKNFPKNFVATLPGTGSLVMRCHIWRKKSSDPGYKLGKVSEHQGFYFYRHDRLIQDGGWCDVIGTTEPHLSLARVEIDIPDRLQTYLKVRSNKAGVDVPASFGDAVFSARAKDGMDFRGYIRKAEELYRQRGKQQARPMLQPGVGIPAEVRHALDRRSIRFLPGEGCSVVWGKLSGPDLIDIDQDGRQITLNTKYRSMLLRGARGGKTDLPLLRTLLYFTLESLLAGMRIGPVERLRLQAFQAAMNAALKLEKQWASK
ncbi:ATP-binding protein [Bradyrhizobium tropiciagri]|uniref:ATP-binding protein n=1 Tax=Bradyrhizobium tropiciagri TaxID=312253 RepID=UPI0010098F89|nr:ATP-binding protein [Bradyrhizobium tropiciagri]